jgi:hypothetical protein
MIVKRSFSTAVLGLAATALSVTPAMAAPPEPVPTEPFEIPGCEFPVQLNGSGSIKSIPHNGSSTNIAPNLRATLTNTETGESVSYVTTGVLHETPTDAGVIDRYTGHNLVWGPGIEGILFTTGTQTFVIDEAGTITLTESHGKVVNVCAVLAP